jgi:hypothetical protein
MNLERHLAVIWRHKGIVIAGVVLGAVLAFLAAFSVSAGSIERRGTETWSSESSVLVTQRGFPWGRVTLPGEAEVGGSKQQFGDPNRFSTLAMLYSVISYSDEVRESLPERPERDQIQAAPLDATGNGAVYLPIVRVTTTADSAAGARSLNEHTLDGLRNLLTTQQRRNGIPPDERIRLNVLNAPSTPVLVSGYSMTAPLLAFLLCVLGAIAFAHIAESLARVRRRPFEDESVDSRDEAYGAQENGGLVAVEESEPWTSPALRS